MAFDSRSWHKSLFECGIERTEQRQSFDPGMTDPACPGRLELVAFIVGEGIVCHQAC
jgi:hypothetical protein